MIKFVVAVFAAGAVMFGAAQVGVAQENDVAAFCKVNFALDREFNKDRPNLRKVNRLLDRVAEVAPAELAGAVGVAVPAFKEDPEAAFEDPAVEDAVGEIEAFEYANCTDAQVDVTLQDYQFVGMPEEIEKGTVGFRLVNEGTELHEFIVFRLTGDDTLEEVLELPEDEAGEQVTEVGAGFVEPGTTGYTTMKLKKTGRYGVVCFIPVGSTDFEAAEQADESGARPHHAEGMFAEFEVIS
jgi:uncharacterized cupredoxin-like copper-binding protein